jgi:hypothetical protein
MTCRFVPRSMSKAASICLALWGLAGCAEEESWEVPMIDENMFENEVYPVLLRDCGFHACHGSEERFFRIWGPGRVRMGDHFAFDEADDDEVAATYQRAVSFIDSIDAKRSLLLKKPLAVEAGGAGHLGVDKFGRNLYRTTDSPGYLTLARWVYSVKRH